MFLIYVFFSCFDFFFSKFVIFYKKSTLVVDNDSVHTYTGCFGSRHIVTYSHYFSSWQPNVVYAGSVVIDCDRGAQEGSLRDSSFVVVASCKSPEL